MLSIVVPVYRNRLTLEELYARLGLVLTPLGCEYEVIFVDDACPDGSLTVLRRMAEHDKHLVIVPLLRNLGQQRAILTGLSHAAGTRIVLMDADLQDAPEAIPQLLTALTGDVSAVFAGRRGAYEPRIRQMMSRAFKWMLHVLSGTPADAGLFVAMDQTLRRRLLDFPTPGPSVLAMIGCAGLPMRSIPVTRSMPKDGKSSYRTRDRVVMSVMAIAWVIRWRGRSRGVRLAQIRAVSHD